MDKKTKINVYRRNIFRISLWKTLRFNLHYFGLKGLSLPVIVSRNIIFRTLGGQVKLEQFRRGVVQLGFGSHGLVDPKYQRGVWENSGTVVFKGTCRLGNGSKISNAGQLVLGNNFKISASSTILCDSSITFGDDCLMAWDSLIMDSNAHKVFHDGVAQAKSRPITIGDHVWIGANCTILKGAHIMSDSVIGAGAMVTKSFDKPNLMIGGINKVIKENVNWEI